MSHKLNNFSKSHKTNPAKYDAINRSSFVVTKLKVTNLELRQSCSKVAVNFNDKLCASYVHLASYNLIYYYLN